MQLKTCFLVNCISYAFFFCFAHVTFFFVQKKKFIFLLKRGYFQFCLSYGSVHKLWRSLSSICSISKEVPQYLCNPCDQWNIVNCQDTHESPFKYATMNNKTSTSAPVSMQLLSLREFNFNRLESMQP